MAKNVKEKAAPSNFASSRQGPCTCVTNKEICFIRVVFILCKALRYLFARLLTEGKTLFFSQADCCVRHLLRQNRYDDIVKFQIGLVILPSSKNFDKRLA